MEHIMSAPDSFVGKSSAGIERANRLISLKANPGWWDLIRLSQDLVDEATAACADFGGWDPQQIVVLKVRMQTAKEYQRLLIDRVNIAIQHGVEEARAALPTMPEKSATEILEQGDYVRQKVLERFEEIDTRSPGSY
jgi:hypothetical protein